MTIAENISKIKNDIATYEKKYGRTAHSVQLLGITKTKLAEDIKQAVKAGLYALGENYPQEALQKIHLLKEYPIEWHFVGHIQSNKTKIIAENFSWVHSIDQLKTAQRLHEQRSDALPRLNCLIQVNIDDEASKSGVSIDNVFLLAKEISLLPRLQLRGVMAIPKPQDDFMLQRAAFRKVHQLFLDLQKQGFAVDTLSMGMSNDFEAAIAEGATLIRIGTALFGPRKK